MPSRSLTAANWPLSRSSSGTRLLRRRWCDETELWIPGWPPRPAGAAADRQLTAEGGHMDRTQERLADYCLASDFDCLSVESIHSYERHLLDSG